MSRRVRLCWVDNSDDGDDEREMHANLVTRPTAYYAPSVTLWLAFSAGLLFANSPITPSVVSHLQKHPEQTDHRWEKGHISILSENIDSSSSR